MFAFLKGSVESIGVDRLALDVGGVGYELACPTKTLDALREGQQVKLFTHLHVSQDAVALYGFSSTEERSMFLRMIGVSRVGPKLALCALGSLSAPELAAAIATGDVQTLSRISGMGKKTAERIVLELKEKIAKENAILPGRAQTTPSATGGAKAEALEALIALGFSPQNATLAINNAHGEDVSELITSALKLLGS